MNKQIENYSEIFKALAHPTRLTIVCGLIKSKECNVSKMVKKMGISQPNISQHLNILKNAGIIKGYRKGSEICYSATNKQVIKLISSLGLDYEKLG